ncbi:MAG: BamA/TamA family outer membrane protein [Acidobacteriota bacterium]
MRNQPTIAILLMTLLSAAAAVADIPTHGPAPRLVINLLSGLDESEDEAAETPPEAEPQPEEEPEDEVEPTKEPRTVNLLIRGEEPDRWNLDLGGGWNEDAGLYARVALATTNFLGRGELFGVKAEVGDEHELYEIEYEIPFFAGRPQSFGVRLFHDRSDHPVATNADFNSQSTGAALSYGRRFGRFQSFRLTYQFADVDETEFAFGATEDFVRRQTYKSSSLTPRWVYDRLDDRLSPFRGLRLSGSLQISGGALGGDSDLVKPVFSLAWFKPMSRLPLKSTFGVRTRLGWIGETGDGEPFAQQLFFSGGENHVRGFRRKSIAAVASGDPLAVDAAGFPIDGQTLVDEFGIPVGGNKLTEISLEYHMLLGGPFRLVLFADAGGVFAQDQDVDFDQMRKSAGAELRLTFKRLRLPLRLIYAQNLDPLPGDRFDDFGLSFGLSF